MSCLTNSVLMRNNTKKAIAGVGVTLVLLIGRFSYHEYKVISDENEKFTDKVHSQGNVIFEQNNLLMKSEQYIEDLKGTKKQLEEENKKVKAILDKQNKNVKKLEKKIDSLEKEVSPTVSKTGGDAKSSSKTLGTYTVTAFTSGIESTGKQPGHPLYGVTASGKKVKEGTTIACPPQIELGTKLYIEDIGVRTCEDRGGKIKGAKLDLYIASLPAAQNFGKQQKEVRMLN